MKTLLVALTVGALGLACQTTDAGKKKQKSVWRDSANGIQVYMGSAPGGVKRVIGTIYADAHSQTDAIDALTAEASRLRADAIYGVRESDHLPGQQRKAGSTPDLSPDRDPRGTTDSFGDFGSERRVRTWEATAVILEPAAPTERVETDETTEPESEED